SKITDQSIDEDGTTGSLSFTVSASGATLTAESSNKTLVPDGNIELGGSGTSRTVTVKPAMDQTGTTTIKITGRVGSRTGTSTAIITVKVSDGMLDAMDTFTVTVSRSNSVNDPPVNKVPGAQSKPENTNLVFSSANGNEVSVSDPDAGNAAIKVTLAVSGGI